MSVNEKIIIGSARIGENGKISGGIAGDQKQTSVSDYSGEVSMQDFYVHSKGWIILRVKDDDIALKLALSMTTACSNANIGYDQNERLGIIKYGTESTTKTECDCSSLVRQCVIEASGKDPGNFNTETEAKSLMNTGLFDRIIYTSKTPLYTGDILVTKSKGHTAIVTEGEKRGITTTCKGIDVSSAQGTINWLKVKASGVQFAILRTTTQNGNADTQLASNIKECKEVGLPFTFYKYMYATTTERAKEEAAKVIDTLKRYGIIPSTDIKIWADVEDTSIKALSTAELTAIVNAFKEVIIANGFGFGLYMGKCDYEHGVVDTRQFADDIWIARYYNGYKPFDLAQDPNEKYKPAVNAGDLWGWQYTSSGKVGGISGNVDLDICYHEIGQVEVEPQYYDTPEFTLIDSLNKLGVYSSYENRKRIAAANGINNYSGIEEQDLLMIKLLKEEKLIISDKVEAGLQRR